MSDIPREKYCQHPTSHATSYRVSRRVYRGAGLGKQRDRWALGKVQQCRTFDRGPHALPSTGGHLMEHRMGNSITHWVSQRVSRDIMLNDLCLDGSGWVNTRVRGPMKHVEGDRLGHPPQPRLGGITISMMGP